MAKYDRTSGLYIETCIRCNTRFGMSADVYNIAMERRSGFIFHCPHGHPQHYVDGKSRAELLQEQLDQERQWRQRAEQRVAQKNDEIDHHKRSAAAYKGKLGSVQRRIKAGVCPCCNRSFSNLAAHMQEKHPDFEPET